MRRSNIDIIADILRLSQAGGKTEIGKTEIMYSANMSYRQLQKYLEYLVRRGFLVVMDEPDTKCKYTYRTTGRGRELLRRIEKVMEIWGDERQQETLDKVSCSR